MSRQVKTVEVVQISNGYILVLPDEEGDVSIGYKDCEKIYCKDEQVLSKIMAAKLKELNQ